MYFPTDSTTELTHADVSAPFVSMALMDGRLGSFVRRFIGKCVARLVGTFVEALMSSSADGSLVWLVGLVVDTFVGVLTGCSELKVV
jgi:hypothetical protein